MNDDEMDRRLRSWGEETRRHAPAVSARVAQETADPRWWSQPFVRVAAIAVLVAGIATAIPLLTQSGNDGHHQQPAAAGLSTTTHSVAPSRAAANPTAADPVNGTGLHSQQPTSELEKTPPTSSAPTVSGTTTTGQSATVSTSAVADSDIDIDGWSQAAQDELADWVSKIYDAVGSDPGYGDIGVDYRDMAVEVGFHGPFPQAADPVIAEAKAAGVTIRKIDVDYGQAAFDEVAVQLAKTLDDAGIDGVTGIGPSPDFSQLKIAGPTIVTDTELQQQVTKLVREITTMPLTFEYGDADIDAVGTG